MSRKPDVYGMQQGGSTHSKAERRTGLLNVLIPLQRTSFTCLGCCLRAARSDRPPRSDRPFHGSLTSAANQVSLLACSLVSHLLVNAHPHVREIWVSSDVFCVLQSVLRLFCVSRVSTFSAISSLIPDSSPLLSSSLLSFPAYQRITQSEADRQHKSG